MVLKAGYGVQIHEDMTDLTQELLTSDPSSALTTDAIACFSRAIENQLPVLSPDRVLDEVIECVRLERMHKPGLRVVLYILAKCLLARSSDALNDELDEVASIMDELIASSSPGDEFLPKCQKFVAYLAMFRSRPSHPEDSEEAIYHARAFLASSSVEDPLYPTWSMVLEDAAKNRFKNVGPTDGLEASSSSDLLLPSLRSREDLLPPETSRWDQQFQHN